MAWKRIAGEVTQYLRCSSRGRDEHEVGGRGEILAVNLDEGQEIAHEHDLGSVWRPRGHVVGQALRGLRATGGQSAQPAAVRVDRVELIGQPVTAVPALEGDARAVG